MNIFFNKAMIYLHELISRKSTGNPRLLAQKLGCSERTAKHRISQLREAGLPVQYSKERQSYYYKEKVEVSLGMTLGERELKRVIGGGVTGGSFIAPCNRSFVPEFANNPGTTRLYPNKAAYAENCSTAAREEQKLNLLIMKLESLKNEKFTVLSQSKMQTVRGGGQGGVTGGGELLLNGKKVKYEQDYMCYEGADKGNDWCGEYLIDGVWTGADCKY